LQKKKTPPRVQKSKRGNKLSFKGGGNPETGGVSYFSRRKFGGRTIPVVVEKKGANKKIEGKPNGPYKKQRERSNAKGDKRLTSKREKGGLEETSRKDFGGRRPINFL